MNIANRNQTRFELDVGQMIKIPNGTRLSVKCAAGELWITENGIAADVVLPRGATYTSARKGDVVVYGFDPSSFEVSRQPGPVATIVAFLHRVTFGERSTPAVA